MDFKVVEDKHSIALLTDKLVLGWDKAIGALIQLHPADVKENWIGHSTSSPSVELTLEDTYQLNKTLYVCHEATVAGDAVCFTLTLRLDDLLVRDTYVVDDWLVERRIAVENTGQQELRLTAVWLNVPGACVGDPEQCLFEAPGNTVRPRVPFRVAARVHRADSAAPCEFSPGVRWERLFEGAPDSGPGILAIHNPRAQATLMTWYYSEVEPAWPLIDGSDGALTLIHKIGLADWLAPGESVSGGSQYILLHRGTWKEALAARQALYPRMGTLPPLYGEPPSWVRDAVIYEVHPSQFGGFLGLAAELPRLKSLGFNTLYLLPFWSYNNLSGRMWDLNWKASGSVYAMRDFEVIEPTLGTEADLKLMVDTAHSLGMRVLFDLVTQGCAHDARYVQEHPEWMARDERGELRWSHDWSDTWSFDWANPDFQNYMLDWAIRQTVKFNADGWRVDAPHDKEPNWDRRIPYHASYTSLGVLRLLERLQVELKRLGSDKVLLCELYGPVYVKSHDFCYDYLPHHAMHYLAIGKLTPWELGEWLCDHRASLPAGVVRVTFTETHDTRDTTPLALALRGSLVRCAEAALILMTGFVPMVWSGEEVGLEGYYQRLFALWHKHPILRYGEVLYNRVGCDDPNVFAIIRRFEEQAFVGLVNFSPHKKTFHLSLPVTEMGLRNEMNYRLYDALAGEDLAEEGRSRWTGVELQDVRLTMEPYKPHFVFVNPEGEY